MVDGPMSRETHFMSHELFSLIQKKVTELHHFILTGRKK